VAWRPCVNCGCDSTGKMTHCYGCPNDPATFKAPPAPAAEPPGWKLVPVALLNRAHELLGSIGCSPEGMDEDVKEATLLREEIASIAAAGDKL
jgi:hypothetical protein